MVKAKIILYKSKTLKNGEHPIMLRLTKGKKLKYLSLGYSCPPELWDNDLHGVTPKYPNHNHINHSISTKLNDAVRIIINFEDEDRSFSFDEFVRKFSGKVKHQTVFKFFEEYYQRLRKAGKIGNARVYNDARRSFSKFTKGRDPMFTDIDYSFLKRFEEYHQGKGNSGNYIAVHMRTLRSLFNKAIKEGYCKRVDYPFEDYNINKLKEPTAKRALTREQIKSIIELELDQGERICDARDYFAFSFYSMGMNFIDMALLKPEDINDGRMVYKRAKTGKVYNIKLLPDALTIVERFVGTSDTYVFPILHSRHESKISIYNRIRKIEAQVNKNLKKIAKLAGLSINLTTYHARHSWATILKRSGISAGVISEGLGHQTEKTTQIYLDSFENSVLDEANESLL